MSAVETQRAVVLKQKANKSLGHRTGGETLYYLENQHCFECGIYLNFLMRSIMQKWEICIDVCICISDNMCCRIW